MNTSPKSNFFDRRPGVVINGALFVASVGIIGMLKLLEDDDAGARLRYLSCLIGVWSVILAIHYAAPYLYKRLNPSDYEVARQAPYYSRHLYRDIHSGLFFGLCSLAWATLLAQIWATGSSINELVYDAAAWGWGFVFPFWAIVFFAQLLIVAMVDKRETKLSSVL